EVPFLGRGAYGVFGLCNSNNLLTPKLSFNGKLMPIRDFVTFFTSTASLLSETEASTSNTASTSFTSVFASLSNGSSEFTTAALATVASSTASTSAASSNAATSSSTAASSTTVSST